MRRVIHPITYSDGGVAIALKGVREGSAFDYLLVSIGTDACCFIVLGAIHVCTIVKGPVPFSDGSSSSLILEMPVEAREWSMLLAFVLEEQRTLVHAKFLQIPERQALYIRHWIHEKEHKDEALLVVKCLFCLRQTLHFAITIQNVRSWHI